MNSMARNVDIPEHHSFPPLRKMMRSEYDELVKKGFFREDERVELIFGMVVAMAPIKPSHDQSVQRIDEMLKRLLGQRAQVFCHGAFGATDDSEPQPDVMVVPRKEYWHEHKTKAFVIVEVARSSLRYDRGLKKQLYGISDVSEYWIVNLVHGVVEVYRDRDNGEWRSLDTYRRGQTIALLDFADIAIPVAEILPPPEMDGEQEG